MGIIRVKAHYRGASLIRAYRRNAVARNTTKGLTQKKFYQLLETRKTLEKQIGAKLLVGKILLNPSIGASNATLKYPGYFAKLGSARRNR